MRTALINHTRGLLGEYGIVLPQGPWHLVPQAPVVIADAELSDLARTQGRMYGAACPYGKFDPYVLVMQSTQDRTGEYATNRLDRARNRRVLVQEQVRARLIVNSDTTAAGAEGGTAKDNHVVNAILVSAFRPVCTRCGIVGADPRPNWRQMGASGNWRTGAGVPT